jgi:putative spermidine/putrescine transport system permease protein
VALFLILPILIIVPMSFSTAISFSFPPPSYWLGYYHSYFQDPTWLIPTYNSFIIAFGVMFITMLVTIPASIGYVRYKFAGKSLIYLLIMSPMIVPHVVSALGYFGFLVGLGLYGSKIGVILAHSALGIPITFLVLTASLKGFDRNLERAAMISGAGYFRTFFYVTLPVLKPGMIVGALFAFLSSFNEAVVAIFIGSRDAATLPKKMYEAVRLESDPVIAVVSTLLMSGVLAGVLISFAFKKATSSS